MSLSLRLAEYVSAYFTGLWLQSHEHDDALREIDKEGRFPQVEDCVPRMESATASFTMPETDRRFLLDNLARLPGDDLMNDPVTVDLNGRVAIRARGEGQDRATELVLSGASRTGEQVRFSTNRRYLAHAATLGFDSVHVVNAKSPVLCTDATRQYVWALLTPESALEPATDVIQIESPAAAVRPIASRLPRRRRDNHRPPSTRITSGGPREPAAARTSGAARVAETHRPDRCRTTEVVATAEALETSLQAALVATGEFIRRLRREP